MELTAFAALVGGGGSRAGLSISGVALVEIFLFEFSPLMSQRLRRASGHVARDICKAQLCTVLEHIIDCFDEKGDLGWFSRLIGVPIEAGERDKEHITLRDT